MSERSMTDAAMKDPALLKEAEQQGLHIDPWSGQELQNTVVEIVNTPEPTLEQIRKVIKADAGSEQHK